MIKQNGILSLMQVCIFFMNIKIFIATLTKKIEV